MRYVDLAKAKIPKSWLDKAVKLQQELALKPNLQEKLDHIEHHQIWQDKSIFTALNELMDGKCWYSEAKDLMSDRDIDHYRPKKRAKNIDNKERDGYWFLAYDWENYRFSSIYSNRLRKDKHTDAEIVYGKGIYFPLKNGSPIASTKRAIVDERPYLIDPTRKTDAALIGFNVFGNVIPNVPKSFTWEIDRVKASVMYYHLDHSPLKAARKVKWNACQRNINKIIELCKIDDRTINDDATIEFLKNQLVEWANEKEILSGVAIACLSKNNMSAILTI